MPSFALITDREQIIKVAPEFKNKALYEPFPFIFLCDDRVVAEGELEFDSGEFGAVEVKMIKTLEKRNGYGRMFVDYLRQLPHVKEIWGEAVPEAVPFWYRVGAKFNEREFQEFIDTEEFEEGYLLPFSIPC